MPPCHSCFYNHNSQRLESFSAPCQHSTSRFYEESYPSSAIWLLPVRSSPHASPKSSFKAPGTRLCLVLNDPLRVIYPCMHCRSLSRRLALGFHTNGAHPTSHTEPRLSSSHLHHGTADEVRTVGYASGLQTYGGRQPTFLLSSGRHGFLYG